MSTLRLNSAATLSPSGDDAPRRVTEDGTEYLVAPTVAIQEGVYRYPAPDGRGVERQYLDADEMEATVNQWVNRPLTLDHPKTASGEPTTIQNGDVADITEIGEVRNPSVDGGKLSPEAWFDLSEQGKHDGDLVDIVNALEAGRVIEVSTGYNSDIRPDSGVYNGESYHAEQTSVSPDHLAVFRVDGKTGNCSVSGGCGVGRVNQRHGVRVNDRTAAHTPESSDSEDLDRDMDDTDNVAVSDAHAATFGRRVLNALGIGTETTNATPESCGCGADASDHDECTCDTDGATTNESTDTSADDAAETAAETDDEPSADANTDTSQESMTDETETDSEAETPEEPTDTETYADDVDTSPDAGEGDDTRLSELEEQNESLREELDSLREKVEAPEREAQKQAREAVANEFGVDPEDVDVSADAAEGIVTNQSPTAQTPRPDEARANMAAVPGNVTRSTDDTDDDVDVPAGGVFSGDAGGDD